MAKKPETEALITPPVSKFSKKQLIQSARYRERRDLLTALLKDGKEYTHADVETLIDEFMKGKVK
jgi:arginine repressor